jgi:plastocyanin
MTTAAALFAAACGSDKPGTPPTSPTPPTPAPGQQVTASAYIMPDAIKMNDWAFGDEPVVVFTGERLRWVNLDQTAHNVVADTPGATDFVKTETLQPGAEQVLTVTKTGTTKIHCSIHPNMVGTLIVREH